MNSLEIEVANLRAKLSFREFILNEARQSGVLYHFTTLSRIEQILKEQKIKKGSFKYISLTRDFQLPNEKGYFNTGEYIVRIAIDGNKLSENVKILPFKDIESGSYNDEREEAVLNNINSKYFIQVDILTSDTRVFNSTAINAIYDVIKKSKFKINKIKKFQPVKI